MELKTQCAVVVGASSGIGAALARRLARQGYSLALVARRESELMELAAKINREAGAERARYYVHDVRDFEAVPELFERVVADLGGLDLAIFAAGTMPKVEPDEYDFDKDRLMVEVNLLGCMAWLNQAADLFSRLGAGCIVGVGSIAGDRGRPGQPAYNTSKGAQAIYLEALRNRLHARGVRVVTIKPGYVDTAMTAGLGNLPFMISPDAAARAILKAARKSRSTVYVPRIWAPVALVLRHIPSCIFRRLSA